MNYTLRRASFSSQSIDQSDNAVATILVEAGYNT